MPSRSNRRSRSDNPDNPSHNDIGYNRGLQNHGSTDRNIQSGVSGGYNHGHSNAGSKRASKNYSSYAKSTYQKSTNQKTAYQKSTNQKSKKYYRAKTKPKALCSRIDSPPEEILLIGDSMLRNIDPDGYKQAVWLFSYPGINASQVRFLKK